MAKEPPLADAKRAETVEQMFNIIDASGRCDDSGANLAAMIGHAIEENKFRWLTFGPGNPEEE